MSSPLIETTVIYSPSSSTPAETPADPGSPSIPGFTHLLSETKEQFWEIEQKGSQLFIRFGKSGSTGQMQVKSFQTEAEAEIMKEQFLAEQKGKGFGK